MIFFIVLYKESPPKISYLCNCVIAWVIKKKNKFQDEITEIRVWRETYLALLSGITTPNSICICEKITEPLLQTPYSLLPKMQTGWCQDVTSGHIYPLLE